MDKDEFQAWKDSPATQWVLNHLRQVAERMEAGSKDSLFHATASQAADWANLQARAAYDRGYVQAIGLLVGLEFEQVSEEDEKIDA